MSSATSILSEWLMWLAGGFIALFTPLVSIVYKNRDRSMENQRRLEGDSDPDGYEGLMAISRETREQVEVLEEKLDRARRERKHEYEAVMDRINELNENT